MRNQAQSKASLRDIAPHSGGDPNSLLCSDTGQGSRLHSFTDPLWPRPASSRTQRGCHCGVPRDALPELPGTKKQRGSHGGGGGSEAQVPRCGWRDRSLGSCASRPGCGPTVRTRALGLSAHPVPPGPGVGGFTVPSRCAKIRRLSWLQPERGGRERERPEGGKAGEKRRSAETLGTVTGEDVTPQMECHCAAFWLCTR